MTTRDFAYWLQGLFEIRAADPNSPKGLTAAQVETIENHLKLVFKHDLDPQEPGDAQENQNIHDGKPPGPFLHGHPNARC